MHMAQLKPLPLTVSCYSKIQTGFAFLVPAHPGRPGKRAVKRVCVCVCVCVIVVFLGGSCNPTTWRSDVAIPFFKQHSITYYNPVCSAAAESRSLAPNNFESMESQTFSLAMSDIRIALCNSLCMREPTIPAVPGDPGITKI